MNPFPQLVSTSLTSFSDRRPLKKPPPLRPKPKRVLFEEWLSSHIRQEFKTKALMMFREVLVEERIDIATRLRDESK